MAESSRPIEITARPPSEPATSDLVPRRQPPPPPTNPIDERGELRLFELGWRAGLLAGAGIFFYETLGWPWQRNLAGLTGMLLSALIILTMTVQWRVLGDWRRRTQQFLIVGVAFVLSFPVAAALNPGLGTSVLPDPVEIAMSELLRHLSGVPGLSMIADLFRGLLAFTFFAFAMLLLVFGNANRRGGVFFVGFLLTLICMFFYPTMEVVIGFIFLGIFFLSQWESALMVPDRLRPYLRPEQLDYLRELVDQGSLSTGETKIYLDNQPHMFAELMEYRLVEFDDISRLVMPGKRLLHDPAAAALESAFTFVRRSSWLAVGVLYFITPDFIPGPIDDFIVLFLCAASGFGFLGQLIRPRAAITHRR